MNSAEYKKISCAVIGLGGFGKHYVRLLSNNTRATLAAVASPSAPTKEMDLGDETKRSADKQNIFDDPSIDAVIIATPLRTHTELAVAALKAGKHVLLEKPLAMNYSEAEEIKKAVEKSGKVFMLGHQYLYNDDIAALKQGLDEGRIDAVRYVHAEQLYAGPIRPGVGCFREAATHEIALIDYLFSPGVPVSVEASGIDLAGIPLHAGGACEDFAAATIHYAKGLFAHIIVSQYSPIKSRRIIFGGDRGMAIFDDQKTDDKVTFSLRPFPQTEKLTHVRSLPVPDGDIFIPQTAKRREPIAQEVEHFLDCIETGATPRSDIAHAMRVEHVLTEVARVIKIA
jgi:predicted dehydrogenase